MKAIDTEIGAGSARRPNPRSAGRARALVATAVALASLAAACGGGGEDASDGGNDAGSCPVGALDGAEGPVEIEVWSNYTALPKRTFEAMVADYNASQDRVVVSFQPQGVSFEEVLRKFKLAAEDDSLPALALLELSLIHI